MMAISYTFAEGGGVQQICRTIVLEEVEVHFFMKLGRYDKCHVKT